MIEEGIASNFLPIFKFKEKKTFQMEKYILMSKITKIDVVAHILY